jgi:hypothetical protein
VPVFVNGVHGIQRDSLRELVGAQPTIRALSSGTVELGQPTLTILGKDSALFRPSVRPQRASVDAAGKSARAARVPQRAWFESWGPLFGPDFGGLYQTNERIYEASMWWGRHDHRVLFIARPLEESRDQRGFDRLAIPTVTLPADLAMPFRAFLRDDANAELPASAYIESFSDIVRRPSGKTVAKSEWFIVDPKSHRILGWNNSLSDPRLEPQPIGDGINYDGFEVVLRRSPIAAWFYDDRQLALRRGSDIYVRKNGRFERWERESGSLLESESPARSEYRIELLDEDALTPRVVVRSREDDRLLFEHDYRVDKNFSFVIAHLAGIAQSPLLNVCSFFADAAEHTRTSEAWNNPLLNGRRRLWLLALNIAVAALFASLAWRSLSHPRANAARWAWTIAIALFGLPAVMARLAVEPVVNNEVKLKSRKAPAALVLQTL